jgi:hemin uptake protein HemP
MNTELADDLEPTRRPANLPDAPSSLGDGLVNGAALAGEVERGVNEAATEGQAPLDGPPTVDFLTLSMGQREVVVRHDGQWYRLRLTRNNRLILQK